MELFEAVEMLGLEERNLEQCGIHLRRGRVEEALHWPELGPRWEHKRMTSA